MLIPCLLLIYVLMCLIASRRPSGKATLWIFLFWILSVIALIVAAIRDSNAEECSWEQVLPAPSSGTENLLNDAAPEPVEAMRYDDQAAPAEDTTATSETTDTKAAPAAAATPDGAETQARDAAASENKPS